MKTHKTFFMTKRLIYFVSVNCPFSDAFFMTYVVVVIHFVLNVKIRRHFYALSHINFVLTVPMCSCRTEKIIVLRSLYSTGVLFCTCCLWAFTMARYLVSPSASAVMRLDTHLLSHRWDGPGGHAFAIDNASMQSLDSKFNRDKKSARPS